MNDADHEHNHREHHSPRWKRVHHSWIFWVAVVLMLIAMIGYVITGDLSWGLFRQPTQPTTRAINQ